MALKNINTIASFSSFDHCYRSYPLSHISKPNHETGNKIIMPASALDKLASLSVAYPMVFRIENPATNLHSHCGVVEFTADEGCVFLPAWMINNMQLQYGDLVNIKNISLPKGTYIKIQPHATKFTTFSDHKSLLENAFKDFVCVTKGDTIVVHHGNDEKYMVDIVETKPSPAILLFETDCVVDFAKPLDYKEPEKKNCKRKRTSEVDEEGDMKKDSKLFPGVGRRLGGTNVQKDNDLLGTDLLMKRLKMTESKTVAEKKHGREFKPFPGVARRVDGQPVVEEEIVQQDQSKSKIEVDVKKDEGFKAFTGKSYRLL